MKKNYELVEIKVISLDNNDVITASGNFANKNTGLLGGNLDFGDLRTQPFGE